MTEKKKPNLAAEILDGRHDAIMSDLVTAVAKRLEGDDVHPELVVTVAGDPFRLSDLTYGALRRFEERAGVKNALLGVNLAEDMNARAAAVLIACRFMDQGMEWEPALVKADGLKAGEVEFDVTVEIDPKDND